MDYFYEVNEYVVKARSRGVCERCGTQTPERGRAVGRVQRKDARRGDELANLEFVCYTHADREQFPELRTKAEQKQWAAPHIKAARAGKRPADVAHFQAP